MTERHKVLIAARVSRRTADTLEAAAYVRRTSMQKVLAPLLEEIAEQLATDPGVEAAVTAREEHDQRAGTQVRQIRKASQ